MFKVFSLTLEPLNTALYYEHDEQLFDPQVAHDEPLLDDDVNLYPTEKPNEDIFFLGFLAPHSGHSGSSFPKISNSNSFPHFSQIYSYMGIDTSLSFFGFLYFFRDISYQFFQQILVMQ